MPTIEAEGVRTARLSLRPLRRSDAETVAAMSDDYEVLIRLSFLPFPLTAEYLERWIDEQPEDFQWLLAVRTQDARAVGVAGIHPDDEGGAEIGFWIGRDHWGRGYASEIAGAVVELAGCRGYDPVWAVVLPDNAASIRVLEKAGFIREGTARRQYRLRGSVEIVHRYRLAGCEA